MRYHGKFIEHKVSNKWEDIKKQCHGEEQVRIMNLSRCYKKAPGCEDTNLENIWEWLANDELYDIIDNDTVVMIVNEEVVESINRITHSEGFKVIEKQCCSTLVNRKGHHQHTSFAYTNGSLLAWKHTMQQKQQQSKTILRLSFVMFLLTI